MSRPVRAEALASVVVTRLSPKERALAEEAARVNDQRLAEFVRDAILTAAGDCLEFVHAPPRRNT